MNNQEIAETFETLADLLEFQGNDGFRLRAYRNAARSIADHAEPIEDLVRRGADLTEIEGVGASVSEKCIELVRTGRLRQLDAILQEVPRSVLDLLRIPKLGPKKAAALFRELRITTLDELREACLRHEVRALSGFGEKTEAALLRGLEIAEEGSRRMPWAAAEPLAEAIRTHAAACAAAERVEWAGSYRRLRETVGDLDLLVVSDDPETMMDHLAAFSELAEVLQRGPTKMSLRLKGGLQVDVRVVPAESFGAAWQYFTGSTEHNVQLRRRAGQLALKLNEWGVFRAADDQRIAGRTEEDVYAALQLPWILPERREGGEELQRPPDAPPERLITLADIRGDLHMHTTASDGGASIEEMAAAAAARGWQYIAITDHSQRVAMARGLDADRLRAQWAEIDRLNAAGTLPVAVLKGVECDILENGELDLNDDVLGLADWVVASVHYGQDQPLERITRRIVGALENPHVDAIAHPTGRLIGRRKPYAVDLEALFDAAALCGKALELNAHPARLDLNDVHLAQAAARGILIVINSDAHSVPGLDVMRFGIHQARRGGLRPEQVLNTRPLDALRRWLDRSQPVERV